MKIENLSQDLDAQTMTAVTGGDNGNSAVNTVGQIANVCVPVDVAACGPANTFVDVDAKQKADVYSTQHAGDAFLVGLPSFPRKIG
jgi:hypothetical protein